MKLFVKRLGAFAAVFIVLISNSQQLNVVYGVDVIMHNGSWNSNAQGIRITIFNLAEGESEATMDFLTNNAVAVYNYMPDEGIIIGTGCKLNYLLDYENNGKSFYGLSWYDNSSAYMGFYLWAELKDKNAFTPIKYQSGGNGSYLFNSDNTFVTDFVAKDPVVAAELFAVLGYYFSPQYNAPGLKFLSEEYVVVVEPIYWFVNNMRDDDVVEWFYGSATEWALYSQSVKKYTAYKFGK